MNICLLAFSAGVIILYCTATLLPWWSYIVALVSFFLCFPQKWLLPGLFLLLGFCYANETATQHRSNILPPSFEGRWVSAVGTRCSLVSANERSQSFRVCASKIEDDAGNVLYGSRLLQISAPLSLTLPPTTKTFDIRLKLKRPRGPVNPVGLPLEQYYFQQKIVATGRASEIVPHLPSQGWEKFSWHSQVLDWREQILTRLQKSIAPLKSQGLIKALSGGRQVRYLR